MRLLADPHRRDRIKRAAVIVSAVLAATFLLPIRYGDPGRNYEVGVVWGCFVIGWGSIPETSQWISWGSYPNGFRCDNRLKDLSHIGQIPVLPIHKAWRSANWLVVPVWPLFIPVIAIGFLLWLRDRQIVPGHCKGCRYNLTGNVSGICPECGMPILASGVEQFAKGSFGPQHVESER